MKAVFWLRMLAWIKRGVLALESIAESQRQAVAAPQKKSRPKMAEVFVPSVEDMNDRWAERGEDGQ